MTPITTGTFAADALARGAEFQKSGAALPPEVMIQALRPMTEVLVAKPQDTKITHAFQGMLDVMPPDIRTIIYDAVADLKKTVGFDSEGAARAEQATAAFNHVAYTAPLTTESAFAQLLEVLETEIRAVVKGEDVDMLLENTSSEGWRITVAEAIDAKPPKNRGVILPLARAVYGILGLEEPLIRANTQIIRSGHSNVVIGGATEAEVKEAIQKHGSFSVTAGGRTIH
jgi:hypothetical protein